MERVAFVMNSLTKGELRAGNRDTSSVYDLLTSPEFGRCDPVISPAPLHECKSFHVFWDSLQKTTDKWDSSKQLIFYFSGHGRVLNNEYCIQVGESDNDYYPFDNILKQLVMRDVSRAILIIDACYSGSTTRFKGNENEVFYLESLKIPRGIMILASSGWYQESSEFEDASGSVFTSLMCQAIRTGLDGMPTSDGLIYAKDIVEYVNRKLETEEQYREYKQRPKFKESDAEGGIWIAVNKSGRLGFIEQEYTSEAEISEQQLRLAYENTTTERRPCEGATVDKINWELVSKYASRKSYTSLNYINETEVLAELDLFAHFPPHNRTLLHKPAVLCFCHNPENFFPQSKSLFVTGDTTDGTFQTEDIYGPLSLQFEELYERSMRNLDNVAQIGSDGFRKESKEIPGELVRELISNAIAHRDYNDNGSVEVRVTSDWLEVRSPGSFKNGVSWDILLRQKHPFSNPVDPAITIYLKNLLVFEQIGRGFDLIRHYISEQGEESIEHEQLPGPITLIRVRRKIHFKKQSQERQKNLILKENLCEQAESLSNSTDWKETEDIFKRLQSEWENIGPVSRGQANKLLNRFNVAKQKFFDSRKRYVEQQSNDNNIPISVKSVAYQEKTGLPYHADFPSPELYWLRYTNFGKHIVKQEQTPP